MDGSTRLHALEGSTALLVAKDLDAQDLGELHRKLSPAIYSGLRTYGGTRFMDLESHLERCQRSAVSLGFSTSDLRPSLLAGLDAIAREAAPADSRLQFHLAPQPLTIRGRSSRIWVTSLPLRPVPEEFLRLGVALDLAPELRRREPLVKRSSWIHDRSPLPLGSRECYEHLLQGPDGGLLEGSSSNLFVIESDRIVTAGEGVLEGITRKLVLRLAAERQLEVQLRAPRLEDLERWREAFVTSSSRGVVPVVEIAGRPIGGGAPGPLASELRLALDDLALREARPAL